MTPEHRLLALLLVCGLLGLAAAPPAFSKDAAKQPYALIMGTVYGRDRRPAYGVTVKIRRADRRKAQWEHISDHQGEFAQRVPPGPADYVIWAETKGKGPKPEAKVHVEKDERVDTSLHLTE